VYGTTEAHQALVDEIFVINGKYVLVEGIPASICTRCGEATFSRETTERIRRMVHGEAQPVRAMAMEIFAYA
jgi:YgiT-type zinc finger domain-containing protein